MLVAEPAVTGKAADAQGLPVAFLPIVEGYVKEGEASPRKLEAGLFQPYPTLTLLMNYKPNEIQASGEAELVAVPAGQFKAAPYAAQATQESPRGRTVNKATLFVSPDMPFGLVRWTATVARAAKDTNEPRAAYAPASQIESTMEAREIRQGARAIMTVP